MWRAETDNNALLEGRNESNKGCINIKGNIFLVKYRIKMSNLLFQILQVMLRQAQNHQKQFYKISWS